MGGNHRGNLWGSFMGVIREEPFRTLAHEAESSFCPSEASKRVAVNAETNVSLRQCSLRPPNAPQLQRDLLL